MAKPRTRRPSGPPLRFRPLHDREWKPPVAGARHVTLAVCPRCDGCARVVSTYDGRYLACTRRLHCPACGAVKDDPQVRLWLRTDCCGHVLWATSAEHLALIEDWVRSPLRERLRLHLGDRRLLARLPRWLMLARHRDEVLRAITHLKRMLPDGPSGWLPPS